MKDRRKSPAKFESALRTIVNKNDKQHQENSRHLIDIAKEMAVFTKVMADHILEDAKSFAEQNLAILEINKDVKSLLASRSFLRGTWFAIVTVGTLVGVLAGLIVAWYR